MRLNLRANAILQRRNNFSSCRVVLRIRAEDKCNIERQTNRISLNLHVALLHDGEQSHLDLPSQIGQYVDRKYPAIGARQQSVMNGQLARQFVSATSRLNRIDVADQIGDGHVRRSKFFNIALIWREIRDRRSVSESRNFLAASLADRRIRAVVNFASS